LRISDLTMSKNKSYSINKCKDDICKLDYLKNKLYPAIYSWRVNPKIFFYSKIISYINIFFIQKINFEIIFFMWRSKMFFFYYFTCLLLCTDIFFFVIFFKICLEILFIYLNLCESYCYELYMWNIFLLRRLIQHF